MSKLNSAAQLHRVFDEIATIEPATAPIDELLSANGIDPTELAEQGQLKIGQFRSRYGNAERVGLYQQIVDRLEDLKTVISAEVVLELNSILPQLNVNQLDVLYRGIHTSEEEEKGDEDLQALSREIKLKGILRDFIDETK